MFEDIYFWTKNGRPDTEKDHDRNASCQYILRKMKTGGVIMKTYHVDPNDPIFDEDFHEKMDRTFFQKDLTPFVKYSLNKKKRWETDGSFKTLKALRNSYKDMDVVVNDRVWLDSCPYWCFLSHINYFHDFFGGFPIRKTAHLDTDNNYQCLISGSVFGQPLKSLLSENRTNEKKKDDDDDDLKTGAFEKPKVAYHILTPPKNYEKLRNQDFCPGSSDRFLKHRSIIHWRRCKIMTEALLDIRYEDPRYMDDPVYFIENDFDKDFGTPSQFYNLMDHFVENFVILKKRRSRGDSSGSSSWSVISDN